METSQRTEQKQGQMEHKPNDRFEAKTSVRVGQRIENEKKRIRKGTSTSCG